ncbi:MAG: 16S rRNA (guanine(527)-N(7))-methyltransferase RsmG [Zoogloeaceae bacterium]|nr:16S rRNA (guanine(527)-N(7))-methyltransferase RsmG [Zoogloeaceae bacterium]
MTSPKMTIDAFHDIGALRNGLAELGLQIPEGAAKSLMAYRELFLKWNRVYNLTLVKHPSETVLRHLLDTLAIVPWLDRAFPETAFPPNLLDVGSGAGLPGIPLAIARPRLRVVLIDADRKKVAFQQKAVIELGLPNVTPRHGRAESLTGSYDIVISRYFAGIGNFLELTRHLIAPGGFWLAMKDEYPETEPAALPAGIRLLGVETLTVPGLPDARRLAVLTDDREKILGCPCPFGSRGAAALPVSGLST